LRLWLLWVGVTFTPYCVVRLTGCGGRGSANVKREGGH
jgi:hypothetical protein